METTYFALLLAPLKSPRPSAIRTRWEIVRACIFCMIAALGCSVVLAVIPKRYAMSLVGSPSISKEASRLRKNTFSVQVAFMTTFRRSLTVEVRSSGNLV